MAWEFERYSKPAWHIVKPMRVGGFHWSFIPESWWHQFGAGADNPIQAAWLLVLFVVWLVEFVIIRPTVGLVRLAVHHSRSPGWYVRVMYTQVVRHGVGDYTVDFRTNRKGEAKRLTQVLRREREQAGSVDLNAPAVRAAVSANRAAITVVSNNAPRQEGVSGATAALSMSTQRSEPVDGEWSVSTPRRVGDFRWGLVRGDWFPDEPEGLLFLLYPLYVAWIAAVFALWLIDRIVIVPIVGPIRLAIHHARSPGWYVRVEYPMTTGRGPEKVAADLRVRTKRRAGGLRRTVRQEFDRGGDFLGPVVQAAIAATEATAVPVPIWRLRAHHRQ